MKFEITDTVKQITQVAMYLLIEIVLLATYSNVVVNVNSDFDAYRGLSITGSVFMMLSFMALLILHYKYIDYGIYALLVIMSFAVFLLLIGMGMVSSYYSDSNFNDPVGMWFIQVCLLIQGFLVMKKLYSQNIVQVPQENKQQNK